MVDDLLSGRVTAFRREQGFGVITLDDGRDVRFDASDCNCASVPEEGTVVRLRVAPARWGGGLKALHVEPRGSSTLAVPASPPTLDEQIAALQREHLVGELSEHVMARLSDRVFGGRIGNASLLDVLDAFYATDSSRGRHDGYLRFMPPLPSVGDALARFATALGMALPRPVACSIDDLVPQINRVLEASRDPRRVYPLATSRHWRAYYLLDTERAQRLAKILPFAPTAGIAS
ncbi:MAG TPA: OB-fold nucleic acid binding domain-containing protein [Kofleriaceae bacterium]